jgi:hypothetical protein
MRSRWAALALPLLCLCTFARDWANCTHRTRLCNGKYLCTDVCDVGSVHPDEFASRGLALQRALQRDERVSRHSFLGTHNSAISFAYGFGIEEDGFAALLNRSLYDDDDLGEGVDQAFSLTDQLRLGVRHVELDITSGYFLLPRPNLTDFYVCHSPVPLDPLAVLKVEAAALRKRIDLGRWQPERLSCLGTRVPLRTILDELRAWLDANPTEFLIVYLDTKPGTMLLKEQADAASALIRSVFGASVYAVSEGDVRGETVRALLARGKRLFFEAATSHYHTADDRIVFTPPTWGHQFGSSQLSSDCAIGGDSSWYTRVDEPAKPLVRGLYTDGSDLRPHSPDATDAVRRGATDCGVHIVSPNYVQPQDFASFVWTWDQGQPSATSGCVVQAGPSGRWSVEQCSKARTLPMACRRGDDDLVWRMANSSVQGASSCPAGFVARAPTNGFANQKLREATGGRPVLLNVSVDGYGWTEAYAQR